MIITLKRRPPRDVAEDELEPELGASITLRALEKAWQRAGKRKKRRIEAVACDRPSLNKDFAVALMRLSKSGDCRERMEQVRNSAWEWYSRGVEVRMGDFSDPLFFDFMSWALYQALEVDESHSIKVGDGLVKLLKARSVEDLLVGLRRCGFCEDFTVDEEGITLTKPANLASTRALLETPLKNDFEMKAVRALARRDGLALSDVETTVVDETVSHRFRYLRQ